VISVATFILAVLVPALVVLLLAITLFFVWRLLRRRRAEVPA
jgi:hypothetical protein